MSPFPHTKNIARRIVVLSAAAALLAYGITHVSGSAEPRPKPRGTKSGEAKRVTTLKVGYDFDHTRLPSFKGYSVVGERDWVEVDLRGTLGIRRRVALTSGSHVLLVYVRLTQAPAVTINTILTEYVEDSSMVVSERFVDATTVGISLGDQSLVRPDSASNLATTEVAFTRANIFVALGTQEGNSPNLLPFAQEIDAEIQALPDVTQAQLDAARPQITTFEAATTDLHPGGETTLTLTASDPGGGSLDFVFEPPDGYVKQTPPPLRYKAGSALGTHSLTVVATNDDLLYSEASINFNVTAP